MFLRVDEGLPAPDPNMGWAPGLLLTASTGIAGCFSGETEMSKGPPEFELFCLAGHISSFGPGVSGVRTRQSARNESTGFESTWAEKKRLNNLSSVSLYHQMLILLQRIISVHDYSLVIINSLSWNKILELAEIEVYCLSATLKEKELPFLTASLRSIMLAWFEKRSGSFLE